MSFGHVSLSLSASKEDEEGEDPSPIQNESSESKDLSSSLNGTNLHENLQVLEIDEDLQLLSAPNVPDLVENNETPTETVVAPAPLVTSIAETVTTVPVAPVPGAFGPSARSAFKRPRGLQESSGGWEGVCVSKVCVCFACLVIFF